jgi:hypothetical protein
MHKKDNVLVCFWNGFRRQNAADLINLFEYFDRLLRILEIACIFYGENGSPKFLFGLALLPDSVGLVQMGARHVVVAVEGPIIIFDPMAEDIGLHPFAELVLIFGPEEESDGFGVLADEPVGLVPVLVDQCLDTGEVFKQSLHQLGLLLGRQRNEVDLVYFLQDGSQSPIVRQLDVLGLSQTLLQSFAELVDPLEQSREFVLQTAAVVVIEVDDFCMAD